MFPTPFLEPPLNRVADDVQDDDDCLFEGDYSKWGILTPPWSPCDSSDAADSCSDCPTTSESVAESPTTRARSDSFLCSCTSCECSGLERVDGPVLRDCMWSQTTCLLPPPTLIVPQTSDASADATDDKSTGDGRPCCPAITAACSNHTDRCVDPKNVFPCDAGGLTKLQCVASQTSLQTIPVTPDCSVTKSPVYDPDSETSAYFSSFSGASL